MKNPWLLPTICVVTGLIAIGGIFMYQRFDSLNHMPERIAAENERCAKPANIGTAKCKEFHKDIERLKASFDDIDASLQELRDETLVDQVKLPEKPAPAPKPAKEEIKFLHAPVAPIKGK